MTCLTAATATDINGVEYFFDCLTAGGHDSSWQNSPIFTDTGLSPDDGAGGRPAPINVTAVYAERNALPAKKE